MFYDGHPRAEPGAIVCRVAPSFLRFGNFELFAARGEVELLTRLADYTLRHHFPELGAPSPETYAAWLTEICRRTALLMAHWMRVGFVHGVMNTDNMSILGLTIDYGPFGFLDNYDPDFTPNTTDAGERRYRFSNQPRVAKWNLIKLAEALYPLIGSIPPLEEALVAYTETYEAEESRLFAAKLGLTTADKSLVDELFQVLALVETDMTLFFRGLANVPVGLEPEASDEALLAPLVDAYYTPDALTGDARARTLAWLRRYGACVRQEGRRGRRPRSASSAWTPSIRSTSCATASPSSPSTPPKRATPRWCSSCWISCATLTTSSPSASATPPSARTGPAIARAARCSPAAPDPWRVCSSASGSGSRPTSPGVRQVLLRLTRPDGLGAGWPRRATRREPNPRPYGEQTRLLPGLTSNSACEERAGERQRGIGAEEHRRGRRDERPVERREHAQGRGAGVTQRDPLNRRPGGREQRALEGQRVPDEDACRRLHADGHVRVDGQALEEVVAAPTGSRCRRSRCRSCTSRARATANRCSP